MLAALAPTLDVGSVLGVLAHLEVELLLRLIPQQVSHTLVVDLQVAASNYRIY